MKKLLFISLISLGLAVKTQAQLSPWGYQYYEVPFLLNPSLSGMENGLRLTTGLNSQMLGVSGGPQTMNLVGEYQYDNRSSLGLQILNDKDGVLGNFQTKLNYSYHLPLSSSGDQLHLGLNLGYGHEYVNNKEIKTDTPIDIEEGSRNYMGADVGIAYSNESFLLQGTFPNVV